MTCLYYVAVVSCGNGMTEQASRATKGSAIRCSTEVEPAPTMPEGSLKYVVERKVVGTSTLDTFHALRPRLPAPPPPPARLLRRGTPCREWTIVGSSVGEARGFFFDVMQERNQLVRWMGIAILVPPPLGF